VENVGVSQPKTPAAEKMKRAQTRSGLMNTLYRLSESKNKRQMTIKIEYALVWT